MCSVALTTRHDGNGVIAGTVTTTAIGPDPVRTEGAPAMGASVAPADDTVDYERVPRNAVGPPEIAVVIALPVASSDPSSRYTAVTAPDGTYTLLGLAPGDYVVMCFAPGRIGSYYDGEYAPDRAEPVHVDGEQPVQGIDFELAPMYYYCVLEGERTDDSDEAAPGSPTSTAGTSAAAVYGTVADESGQPVANATVYLLNSAEQPVGYAQAGSDGSFELSGAMPGGYRVYASKLGFTGSCNGNQRDFAAAESLELAGGQLKVDLVLFTGGETAMGEEAEGRSVPLVMALYRNYPNPFNPETRIAFTVPASGRATVRIHNALGQQVAVLFDALAEAGRGYEVDFRADGVGAGIYFYTLEFEGLRLARSMTLVK